MEPYPRKFKADISDKYVQRLMNRRQQVRKSTAPTGRTATDETQQSSQHSIPAVSSDTDAGLPLIIKTLPFDMLSKPKTRESRGRRANYEKPENWIQPQQEPKPSRGEALRREQMNISKMVRVGIQWSRAAQCLDNANRQSSSQGPSLSEGHIGPIRKLKRAMIDFE